MSSHNEFLQLKNGIAAVAVLGFSLLPLGAQAAILDDFNRADGPIGASWTNQSGSCSVVSNQATCSGLGITTINGGTGTTVEADVFHNGSSDDYIALILGYANAANNLYIKLQSQDSVQGFDKYAFYFGTNGSNSGAWAGSGFFNLNTSFTSAHMIVSLVGTTLTLSLDTNLDNTPDQIYSNSTVPVGLLGTGVGMGGWTGSGLSGATLDNFAASSAGIPEPASLALLGLGLAGLAVTRRRKAA